MPVQYEYDGKIWNVIRDSYLLGAYGASLEDLPVLHKFVELSGQFLHTMWRRHFGIHTLPLTNPQDAVPLGWLKIAMNSKGKMKIKAKQLVAEMQAIRSNWMMAKRKRPSMELDKIERYNAGTCNLHPMRSMVMDWMRTPEAATYSQKAISEKFNININTIAKWRQAVDREITSKQATELVNETTKDTVTKLAFTQDPSQSPLIAKKEYIPEEEDILTRLRFNRKMFTIKGRLPSDNENEEKWFRKRLEDWEKILSDPRAETLARQLLLKELDLERARTALNETAPVVEGEVNKDFTTLRKLVSELEEEYRLQWDAVDKACPMASQIAAKARITSSLADFIRCYQDYINDGSNDLIDGIFTAHEIQVLMRQSTQCKIPQYRFGWCVAKNLAKVGLWYRDWRPEQTQENKDGYAFVNIKSTGFNYFKTLDEEVKKAINETRVRLGIEFVDLENDGPAGEYPDFLNVEVLNSQYEIPRFPEPTAEINNEPEHNNNSTTPTPEDNSNDGGRPNVQPDASSEADTGDGPGCVSELPTENAVVDTVLH